MVLFLTSAGLTGGKITEVFLTALGKPTNKIKALFIPTAALLTEKQVHIQESLDNLMSLGVRNIKTLNLDELVAKDFLADFDLVFVCGGNTFYLMQKIKESGFDKALKDFKGLYFGVSAGSIVIGSNIEIASPWDENTVNLTEMEGVGLVDFSVCPHYIKEEEKIIRKIEKETNIKIKRISDHQAILVLDGKATLIED